MSHEGVDSKLKEAITQQFGKLPEFGLPRDLTPRFTIDYSPQDGFVKFVGGSDTIEYYLDQATGVICRRELRSYWRTISYWDGRFQLQYNYGPPKDYSGSLQEMSARISYHSDIREPHSLGQELVRVSALINFSGDKETRAAFPFPLNYAGHMKLEHLLPGAIAYTEGEFGLVEMFIKNDDPSNMVLYLPDKKRLLEARPLRFGEVISSKSTASVKFRATQSSGLVTFECISVDGASVSFPFIIDCEKLGRDFEGPDWKIFNQRFPVGLIMSGTSHFLPGSQRALPANA